MSVRAVVQRAYGEPRDVLAVREVPDPEPGEGEVLVRVRAASVHADVWHVVHGLPLAMRLMGAGLSPRANAIPGTDVAGVVERAGPGATRFRPGDEVFGEVVRGHQWLHGGAFAELVAVRETALARKPTALTFEEAACVATSGIIALRSVRHYGRAAAGSRVLVNGAAGAVGSLSVAIAKAIGAHVTGIDFSDKLETVRAHGADAVIDAAAGDVTRAGERYDLVIDVPANYSFAEWRRVLRPGGRYVFVGHDHYGARGHRWLGGIPRGLSLVARAWLTPELPRVGGEPSVEEDLEEVRALAERGALKPVIDRVYPLEGAADALEHLTSGRARGRIVLRP